MEREVALNAKFWVSQSGNEPVREWLLDLSRDDRRLVGQTIMTVQYRWPLGMPTVRKMEADLWEVRCHLTDGKIARVLFTIFEGDMVLLHGFVKKSQKTPKDDLHLAIRRMGNG